MKNKKLRIYTERHMLRNPALTVLMKISVDGHFDEPRFEKALQKLKHVHPLLYSSVVIDNDGEAYYRENAVQRLELHCAMRERKDQWLEVAETENKHPFHCEKGPLVRFFVFYSETDFDILAIVQHLIGDGDAIARLLRDVVTAYAGIDLSHQDQILISSQNDFPHTATPTFLVKAFTRTMNKMWDKGERRRFGEHEFQEMFFNYHQIADIGLSYSTINSSEMNDLYIACKAHGVTVNEAIVTALIGAMQEICLHRSNKKTVVGVPINMRRQLSLPTDDCLGNFASAVTIKELYDTKKDFWQNAVQVRSKLKSKLESAKAPWVPLNLFALLNPLLTDAMYFAAYGNCDDMAAKKAAAMLSIDNPSSTAVSNLGRLNFDCQIGSYHIRDMVFFAPKAPGSYVVLGVATLADKMQIGFSYDRKKISSDTMEDVSSTMLELLISRSQR
ncbi:condensation domain-containing protein [Paenibacillus sp. FSL H7-0326]|uniref:condensation domain-containing protein n=1 Tax=Paenibacillus sp. FSL H7-0326 TaxID=1921144 RepID=UPI0009FA8A0E|nr:condensation domain-containing protein [Paenibacillus sp. FSL H7-0326]